MKKSIIIWLVIALIVGGEIWWYFSNKNQNSQNNYNAGKSATNVIQNTNTTINNSSNTNKKNETNIKNNTNTQNQVIVPKKENQIAQFATKIYNKDKERQNNIGITCKALSNKEIQPGETFSFVVL